MLTVSLLAFANASSDIEEISQVGENLSVNDVQCYSVVEDAGLQLKSRWNTRHFNDMVTLKGVTKSDRHRRP